MAAVEDSYSSGEEPADCGDGPRVEDPPGDLRNYPASAPDRPIPSTPKADLRALSLAVEDGRLCITYEMAGEVKGPMYLRFDMGDLEYAAGAAGVGQHRSFDLEVLADGRARITGREDEHGNPVPVTAEIGVAGNKVVVQVDPDDLGPGVTKGTPPLDDFAFDGAAGAPLAPGGSLRDDLGAEAPSGYFRYPGGEPVARTPTGPPGIVPGTAQPPPPGPPGTAPPSGP
jgi:hypothetical protein